MKSAKKIISITGATAVGKTSYAIDLAQKLQTEIVSFDSRQIYRALDIGVARPTPAELRAVPHHLIACKSIHEPYSAQQYAEDATQTLHKLFETYDTIVMVGGTGLYLNALRYGLDEIPEISEASKAKVQDTLTKHSLLEIKLKILQIDPEIAIDWENSRRVQRFLEVYSETGKSIRHFQNQPKTRPDWQWENIVLTRPREILYRRINERVENMMDMGLEKEAFAWKDFAHLPAMQTVGYREWQPYFRGETTQSEVLEKIKQHTRNYAKRQLTWFKKFYADDPWIEL